MRPAKLAGPFSTMLSAGDGARSVIGARAGTDAGRDRVEAEPGGDLGGERLVDVAEVGHHAGADPGLFALGQLEHERGHDVGPLDRSLADQELARLAVVVAEAFRAHPLLGALDRLGERGEPAAGVLSRSRVGPRVRFVVHPPDGVGERHVPVLLEVGDRTLRRVDRQVGEVRPAETLELGVEVGEVAPLQQRIVGEVDAGDDVLRAERHLLGLGEEVVDGLVEHQPTDPTDRHQLLGDDLGGVEDVEVERVGELVVEDLETELPLGEVTAVDGVPQVPSVEVGIGAVDLHRLVPDHRLQAELGLPVELDERRRCRRRRRAGTCAPRSPP